MEVQSQTVQLHLLGARKAPMNQDEFDTKFNYMKGTRNRRVSLESRQVDCCVCCRLNVKAPTRMPQTESDSYFPRGKNFLARYLPFTQWMTKYNFRQKFPGDLCAGITVGLHSVAQGFAFAFLAGLPPICGLYTAFFSALIYTFLGTSRLNFMGGNVVICFLTRNIVERISVPYDYIYLLPSNSTDIPDSRGMEQIRIVSTLTFLTALIQACMYALRLDFLLFYLSQQVLSGFSFGLAIRIAFNQMQHVLHVKGNSCISELSLTLSSVSMKAVPPTYRQCAFLVARNKLYNKTNGYVFNSPYPNYDFAPISAETDGCLSSVWDCLDYVNLYTMALSACVILFLLFARQILISLLQMRVNFFEFFLMVFATLMSDLLQVKDKHYVETLTNISSGFMVTLPKLSLLDDLIFDAFAMALLVFASHNRLALTMGKNYKYSVDTQMEQVTISIIGIVSSFFGAHPAGGSLGRNKMAAKSGSNSLLTNLVVVVVLVPFIFGLGALFVSLPTCVLACLVLASLWECFGGVSNFGTLWKVSKLDVATWVFSCVFTAVWYNSTQALFASVVFAIGTIVVRTQWPKFQLLVNVTGSGAYYAERNYYGSELLDESGVAVMRFESALLFNNCAQFRRDVLSVAENIKGQIMGVGIGTRTGSMKSANAASIAGTKDIPMRSTLLISGDIVPNYDTVSADSSVMKVVIIDFSSISITDASGLETMVEIYSELADRKVKLLFASVNATVRNRFKECGGFDVVPKSNFFPSVHDAVLYSQQLGGMVAPSIHMSVSMNGCRDLITLSTATSHHNFGDPTEVQVPIPMESSLGGPTPRPSLPESGVTPPPTLQNKLRATTSNSN